MRKCDAALHVLMGLAVIWLMCLSVLLGHVRANFVPHSLILYALVNLN